MGEELQVKLSELGRLTQLQEDTKTRIDALKAWFERHATQELADTKEKTWEAADAVTSVVVGNSSTVKVISPTLLREIFGDLANDLIEEKTAVDVKTAVKPILAGIFLGEYIEQTPTEVIAQITADEAERKTLKKKLKGNYSKDKQALKDLLDLNDSDAAYYAYMFTESMIWDRWKKYTAKSDATDEALIEKLSAAIIVDEGIKTTVKVAK